MIEGKKEFSVDFSKLGRPISPRDRFLIEDYQTREKYYIEAKDLPAGSGPGTTETFPDNSITTQAVGGLAANTDISGMDALEVLSDMLMAELWPAIVAPSSTFTISPAATYQKVGASITVTKTKTFSQGSISPAYGPNAGAIDPAYGVRSGALVDYTETNPANFTDGQPYTVVLGAQSWTCKANYATGPQPYGSKGTDYLEALAAGSTGVITRTITGVYPVLSTSVSIATFTEQSLQAHGSDIIASVVAESGGNKQSVQIPAAWGTIHTLQQLNTLSNQYDAIDLSSFTVTDITIGGVAYKQYTHNGATIGARTLKFKI